MARNNQRLKLQYGGLTSAPDDYLCPDGELMACIGLEDNAGAKMSAMRHAPKEVCRCSTISTTVRKYYDVIYVHDMASRKIAILKYTVQYPSQPEDDGAGYAWMDVTSGWPSVINDSNTTMIGALANKVVKALKHVGNTLIVNTGNEMHYLVYKSGSTTEQSFVGYKHLGTKLPTPNISFGIQAEYCQYWEGKSMGDNSEDAESEDSSDSSTQNLFELGIDLSLTNSGNNRFSVDENQRSSLTDAIMAKVNKCVSEGVERGWFMQPFLVRYALKLYDGSTTMASAPVYMPVCHPTSDITMPFPLIEFTIKEITNVITSKYWHIEYIKAALDYAIDEDSKQTLKNWSDIIKGITVAVSEPIYTYNPASKIDTVVGGFFAYAEKADSKFFLNCGIESVKTAAKKSSTGKYGVGDSYTYYSSDVSYPQGYNLYGSGTDVGYPFRYVKLPAKGETELKDDIQNKSVFYVLKEINTEDLSTDRKIIKVKRGYLSTIHNQLTLKDSYHAHDQLSADVMYSYNGRINLAGIKRKLYDGFKVSPMYPYINSTSSSNTIQMTYVVEENGEQHIVKSASEAFQELPRLMTYMYYPNECVKSVWIVDTTSQGIRYRNIEMTEHTGLNGSVYVGDIADYPKVSGSEWTSASVDPSPAATTGVVSTPQKLYTSNALNPFVFEPSNINTIGNSRILGMAIAAKAISLGQAGYYPMYCMTEDGVWILEVSETGGWKGKQAIMRDVCTVPEAIIETDGAVIMPTSRGLMLLQGEQSVCLTDANNKSAGITASDLPRLVDVIRDKWNLACQDITRDVIVDIDEYLHSSSLRGVYDYKNNRVIYYRPDRDYSVVLSMGQSPQISTQKWDLKDAPYCVSGCPIMIESNGNKYLADLSGTDYTITGTDDIPLVLNDKAIIITRPIKGTDVGMRDVRKQLDTVWHQGRYKRGSFDILLYGTEDYSKWHLIGQAKDSTGLYGHHGQHWMAFILVIYIKNMTEKDCIDCIDLTMTARLSGKSAAIVGYK